MTVSPSTTRVGAIMAAGLVAVSAVAVALTGLASPSVETVSSRPTEVPATNAQLSCPETMTGQGVATSVLAVTPPSDGARSKSAGGDLSVQALTPEAASSEKTIATTDRIGVPLSTTLTAAAQPSVVVNADGAMAPGAFGAQRSTLSGDKQGGLAIARCEPTGDEWWFTGVDTSVGSTSRLVLSNPTPAVSVVDLRFYGPKGVVSAVGAKGVPVAPHASTTLDLARFAPGLGAVTLHVRATRGRVAAAVDVARLDGVTPAGNEWVAPSEPPSDDVLVDAGDSGDGDQQLVVTNTSAREALVGIEVLDKDGPFTPQGLTDLRIKPGRTLVKDVSTVTRASAAALHVTTGGQGTVTAALVSENSSGPVDLSTSSSSPELDAPAVVPVFGTTNVSLAFATRQAGGGAVRIQAYDDSGASVGSAARVPVKTGTTQVWDGPVPRGAAYLVVSVPDGSGVHAVATFHSAQGLSSIPVVSGTWTVTRPAVNPAD